MTVCQKPTTDKMQERKDAILKYLWTNKRFCTKDELMMISGCTNERSVRDIINGMRGRGRSIVSMSDRKGYYYARCTNYMTIEQLEQELELCIHTWKEYDSRINELKKGRKAFIRLYNQIKDRLKELRGTSNG